MVARHKPPPTQLDRIEGMLQTALPLLHAIVRGEKTLLKKDDLIMTTVAELTKKVEAEETVGDGMATLLAGLKAQLDAAGTDPVALAALGTDLDTHAAAWSAAVIANTPAAAAPAA